MGSGHHCRRRTEPTQVVAPFLLARVSALSAMILMHFFALGPLLGRGATHTSRRPSSRRAYSARVTR